MLAGGNETEAYGYVAKLFEGMEVTQAQHLTEENFRLNVEHLVREVAIEAVNLPCST